MYVLILLSVIHHIYCDCGLLDSSYYDTPDLISILYIDDNTETGSEVMFSCPRGYNLTGTSRAQCDGDWHIQEKPKCVEVECPVPGKVSHGHLHSVNLNSLNRFTFGSAYTVRCHTGYMITGSLYRTCMENGSWSGEPVGCRRVYSHCDLSSRIENGIAQLVTNPDIKSRYSNRTIYNIVCNSGYRVKGSSIVECGDIDIPMCESEPLQKPCPKLSRIINNGHLKLLRESTDETVYQIECDDGYIAGDMRVLLCLENGTWSSFPPYCKPLQHRHIVETIETTLDIAAILGAVCVVLIIILMYLKRNKLTKQGMAYMECVPNPQISNYIDDDAIVDVGTDETFLTHDSGYSPDNEQQYNNEESISERIEIHICKT